MKAGLSGPGELGVGSAHMLHPLCPRKSLMGEVQVGGLALG